MINKNVRIAIQLQHKDDNISANSGTIAYGDYQWKDRRFLYHANGNNEWVMFKDAITGQIDQVIKDIININGTTTADPSLTFLYQIDKNGNAYYSDEVNAKWKEWMKANYRLTKPNITCAVDGNLEVQMTPMFHSRCVMTTVRFAGDKKDYADIGKLTEALIEQFVNIENNLTFRVVSLYDKCMKITHDLHLLDVNQDAKLLSIWADISDSNAILNEVANWLDNVDFYQKPAKEYTINLSTSDPSYMYKYMLEETIKGDGTPVYNTTIATENVTPAPFAELLHTKAGVLLDGFFTHGAETEYTRRDMISGHSWNSSVNAAFQSNPQNPTMHYTAKFGDADHQTNTVVGSVSVDYRRDVVTNAYYDMPWMTVDIECYNFNGNLIKTVAGVWDANGSTKLTLDKNMLSGNHSFKAVLNGYYAVRTKLRVYWGRFGSWTDEIKLAYIACDGDDNSGGGPFSINKYVFNNQSNRILTRAVLHDASKYERNIIINGRGYGWGWNGHITWDSNATFSIPGSSNWHYTSWYGQIFEKPGCDFKCADWWTRWSSWRKTGERDERAKLHYPDAANYSILTTANLSVTYSGMQAKYSQDWYNTPSLFAPITNDCTVMLRGGSTYRVISHCQNLEFRQIGVYKVDVGTIDVTYRNTKFYGRDMIMGQDFILTGKDRGYKFDVVGNAPSVNLMASGVPTVDETRNAVRTYNNRGANTLFLPYQLKPKEEVGMGLLSKINLVREHRLDEVPNKHLEIIDIAGDVVRCKIDYVTATEWTQLHNDVDKGVRVYARIVGSTWLYILTYHINVKKVVLSNTVGNTLEFVLRDNETGDITHTFPMLEYPPKKYITMEYEGRQYFVEISETTKDEKPVTLYSDDNKIIGYLK